MHFRKSRYNNEFNIFAGVEERERRGKRRELDCHGNNKLGMEP
jgi:hypothetical protein